MYPPGGIVMLSVALSNSTAATFNGTLQLAVTHLGGPVTNFPVRTVSNLAVQEFANYIFLWLPPATNYQGYLVTAALQDTNGNVVDNSTTAVDVSGDWARFPRYGYVAWFNSGLDTVTTMSQLKNYHLNGLQFYDWQWKHHIPYNGGSSWPDVANRTNNLSTVTSFISLAHGYGMVAMNYNLYGGAYANYATDGSGVTPAMGIFSGTPASAGNQLEYILPNGWATSGLYEMNNRDTNWQNYIFGREAAAFTNLAFDGWHIDALGQHSVYDYSGAAFNLDDYNAAFISNAVVALGKRMTFNTVDAVGENQVAQFAPVDFVYSELWAGNPDYLSFNQRVDNVRSFGSKALVMPAYMDYGATTNYFDEAGVRLTDAAMFACGASHLELGDGDKMLHKEYFPDDSSVLMTASLQTAMQHYYDFLVAYENLLRDNTVSATNRVTLTGAASSTNGSAGTVWLIVKKNLGHNILHLVNLVSNTTSAWRDTNSNYVVPPTLTNLAVKFYYTGSLAGGKLWCASPDTNNGAPAQLNFTPGSDGGGNYISFTVPQLQYWDMVWLELNGLVSATNQFKAQNYDTLAGVATETTSDTGGGLDIGNVKSKTGDSYIGFANVDFLDGAASVSARVASALDAGSVEFHLDSPAGPLIGAVTVGNTGGWQNWVTMTAPVTNSAGVHAVFAVFKGEVCNLNWFQFNQLATNSPPALAPLPDQTILAGTTLVLTNVATDTDQPPQTLTFGLLNAPAGALLNATNGVFAWRPAIAQSPSTQTVGVVVSDSGTPVLSATQSFSITVNRPASPQMAFALANGALNLSVTGDPGPDYTIQTSTNLSLWQTAVTTNSPALPWSWSDTNLALPQRFYRVLLGP
jgi:dextranase